MKKAKTPPPKIIVPRSATNYGSDPSSWYRGRPTEIFERGATEEAKAATDKYNRGQPRKRVSMNDERAEVITAATEIIKIILKLYPDGMSRGRLISDVAHFLGCSSDDVKVALLRIKYDLIEGKEVRQTTTVALK